MKLRWKMITVVAACLAAGMLLTLGGCSKNNHNEFQRLVCEVQHINGGAPLVSGYWNAGQDRRFPSDDDFLPIDHVTVTFHARPYSSLIVLPEDAPHSYFHVTGYDLIWHPVTAGSDSLANYNIMNARTDILVPVNEEATVAVLVADRYMKEQPWFYALVTGAQIPFMARAELRFRGHETGSESEVELVGSFMVSFVGVVVEAS